MKNRITKKTPCHDCHVAKLCLGPKIEKNNYEKIEEVIKYKAIYEAGEHLYLAPKRPNYFFALYDGCCKEYYINQNGEEIITEFYMPGDIIGLEYRYAKHARFHVRAIQKSTVCLLPIPGGQEQKPYIEDITAWQATGRYLTQVALPHTTSAQARVAAFFIDIIYRGKNIFTKATPMTLPMMLLEVSHKIGVAHETLSRILNKFKKQKILVLEHHTILQYDVYRLKEIAGIEFPSSFHNMT